MIQRNLFSGLFHTLVALPFLLAGPALAADAELQECLKLAEMQPDEALERAAGWQAKGGGTPARLCHALALFHRGDFAEAGRHLEDIATELGQKDPRAGAAVLGRAGWAWLRAGDSARAERLYTAALERQPGDADLLVDRAIARAEGERYWDAVDDLNTVLAKDPARADAWLYRAAAHKALSNTRQALADVAQALELKPGDPEALLLRGNVKALAGDAKGARDDWKLVERVAPDSSPARVARGNLAGLERSGAAK
ncbi:tetratricopeptide repeat protein [Azospirillum sp.]|uniref:tetratricopeptide repeat protein n=1 Tax=Azospirillum sp. TaxID=34012 RepID=UPI003D74F09F